ncbi:proline-rich protein HaeIII subfamily 1 [Drosophila miranda]|uniref:proline-rich protein HaeIII subfamily 1 n=1 Tax=Drosophila miranda TaxID=7229 RepID=UPI0007E79F66|nr:proline-rich protein HaeIII subfamily 1 [Drosophila miranda]
MHRWPLFLVLLLLPLIKSDVSHLPKDYIPPTPEEEESLQSIDHQETPLLHREHEEHEHDPEGHSNDVNGFYPSLGLPLPPGYAVPTGNNVPPPPAQPPNFPLPIYPPYFGFGGPQESVDPNGSPFGSGPPNAAIQQPPQGAPFPQGGPFPNGGQIGPFPGQGGPFPGQGGPFPGQGSTFPGQGGPFPGQGGPFPGQGSTFPGQGGPFPGQGSPFPEQGGPLPGQVGPFPGQGSPFPGQAGPFPGQGGPFPGQGSPFPGQGGSFPQQGNPFPGPFPPDYLTNQGLPIPGSQSPFQQSYAGFNVPPGFGGPQPQGSNPFQQFGPGFGGPGPQAFADEPEKPMEEEVAEPEKYPQPQPVESQASTESPKSGDTIYGSNGGYVYQRVK